LESSFKLEVKNPERENKKPANILGSTVAVISNSVDSESEKSGSMNKTRDLNPSSESPMKHLYKRKANFKGIDHLKRMYSFVEDVKDNDTQYLANTSYRKQGTKYKMKSDPKEMLKESPQREEIDTKIFNTFDSRDQKRIIQDRKMMINYVSHGIK